MEIALSQDVTDDELKRFNYYILFVGAMYLSEICKAEGSALVPGISKGDTSNTEYKTSLRKPRQKKQIRVGKYGQRSYHTSQKEATR